MKPHLAFAIIFSALSFLTVEIQAQATPTAPAENAAVTFTDMGGNISMTYVTAKYKVLLPIVANGKGVISNDGKAFFSHFKKHNPVLTASLLHVTDDDKEGYRRVNLSITSTADDTRIDDIYYSTTATISKDTSNFAFTISDQDMIYKDSDYAILILTPLNGNEPLKEIKAKYNVRTHSFYGGAANLTNAAYSVQIQLPNVVLPVPGKANVRFGIIMIVNN